MRYNSNPNSSSNWVWRGNAAPPLYPSIGAPGDPRISYYLDRSWTVANYANNSSWGGRLILTAVPAQLKPSDWPDDGHDSTLGKKPTQSLKPDVAATQVALTPQDASKWISRLSTTGSMASLAELGNIFDPGQWNYPIPTTNTATGLPDIPLSATADSQGGGGYTLCVGRPEFSIFDVNGQRAWQLLDVFGLGPRRETSGLVNVNTASFEALRALAAGILLNRDSAISYNPNSAPPGGLYPPTANARTASEDPSRLQGGQANLFAEAIIQSRPFLSPAQLQTALMTPPGQSNPVPFFGNPTQWIETTPPTEWNDAGREELFSKIFNLTTVRSRNFRVFVTGQSLDRNGKVLSTVSKVFQVFLKPTRDPLTGAIQSQQAEIKYEAFL